MPQLTGHAGAAKIRNTLNSPQFQWKFPMNSTDNLPKAPKRRSTSFPLILLFAILGLVAYYFDAGPRVMTYIMYLQESRKVRTMQESINQANPYVPPTENEDTKPREMSAFERAIQIKPEPQPDSETVAVPETPTVPTATTPEPTVPAPKIDEPSNETPKE